MPICIYLLVRPVSALGVRGLEFTLSSGHGKQELCAGADELLLTSDTQGPHPSPGHHLHQWITASPR